MSIAPTTSDFVIEVQGLDTLQGHFEGLADLIPPLTFHVVDFYGANVVENARRFVPIDSGDTLESIHKGDGGGSPDRPLDGPPVQVGDAWEIDIGPTTYYARWVEFGTVLNQVPQPFMIPAIDLVEPAFVASMFDIATLTDQWKDPRGGISGHPPARAILSNLRSVLYTTSKAMGDINAFVGRDLFGGTRGSLLFSARILGDVNAVMSNAVSARISRRLSGRVTGRLAGYGSATLSHAKTYSAFPGGAAGHRIYNRVAGRVLSSTARSTTLSSLRDFSL